VEYCRIEKLQMNRTATDEVTRGTIKEYARSGCLLPLVCASVVAELLHVPQADRRGVDRFVRVCQEVRKNEGDAAARGVGPADSRQQ
jgi:phage host-nuclease inhibitor protein Gam